LLADPRRAAAIGRAAHERVAERYLVPTHLGRYLALLDRLAAPVGAPVGDPA
jgi:hypothetical protein